MRVPTGGWIRWCQPERPVRTMGVVAGGVDPQDLLEVASSDEQQPGQALGALGAEHVVEAAGELRVAVAQEEAWPPCVLR